MLFTERIWTHSAGSWEKNCWNGSKIENKTWPFFFLAVRDSPCTFDLLSLRTSALYFPTKRIYRVLQQLKATDYHLFWSTVTYHNKSCFFHWKIVTLNFKNFGSVLDYLWGKLCCQEKSYLFGNQFLLVFQNIVIIMFLKFAYLIFKNQKNLFCNLKIY